VYSVVEYSLVPNEGTISIRAFFAKNRCLSLIGVDFKNRFVPKYTKIPDSGDLAYIQSACAPPPNVAGRRGGGDVKLLANPLSS
jgi:hypothetical protein